MATDRLSQTEVARLLGMSRAKVRAWTRAGVLPHLADPETGRPWYSRRATDAFLARTGEMAAERAGRAS
jgi:DNA-binding transcriptional MerR regulator